MKSRKAVIQILLIIAWLAIVAASALNRSWILFLLSIGVQVAILISGARRIDWPAHSWSLRANYRPRPTDAGRWVDAPIAEVDKSTVGKLLTGRLRRNPGLRVVVRGGATEPHPASSDSLYDPELDG